MAISLFAAVTLLFCLQIAKATSVKIERKHAKSAGVAVHSHTHTHVHPHTAVQGHVAEVRNAKTLSCPTGYWFQNGKCTQMVKVPFSSFCPYGSVEEDEQCVLWVPPSRYECPEGTTLKGIDCVVQTTIPFSVSCPDGTIPINETHCSVPFETQFICPDGAAAIGNRCLKLTPMSRSCPESYVAVGGVCSQTELSDPILLCPAGMIQEGHICRALTEHEPACPLGTTDLGENCATYHDMVTECPDGYNLTNAEACIQTVSAPKVAVCPNGGDPSTKCKSTVAVPLVPKCDASATLIDGQCVKLIHTNALFKCADDHELRGEECLKVVEYDCSETSYDIECESPKQIPVNVRGLASTEIKEEDVPDAPNVRGLTNIDLDHSKKVKHSDHAVGAHTSHSHGGHVIENTPILPVCKKVPKVEVKSCTKTIKCEAEPYCLDGVLRGINKCETSRVSEPIMKCEGRLDALTGECFVEQRTAIIYECPAGFSDDGYKKMTCSSTTSTDPIIGCPPNTEGPSCVSYTLKGCPGGVCHHHVVQAALDTCPEGFVKTTTPVKQIEKLHGGHPRALTQASFEKPVKHSTFKKSYSGGHIVVSLLKTTCVKTHYADMVGRCPDNWEQLDPVSCGFSVDPIDVSKSHTVPTQASCEPGYVNTGKDCEQSIITIATAICPADTTSIGNRCHVVSEFKRECPSGSIEENDNCWVASVAEPLTVDTVVEGVKIRTTGHSHGHH